MTTEATVVEGRGLVRTYHGAAQPVRALRGVDIQVRRGELLAITGPSGSGKSTLLHLLAGIDRPDEGDVHLDGEDLAKLGDEELSLLRRRKVGIVLQFFNLLPTLSAVENVAFPLMLDGVAGGEATAQELLARVGLEDRASHLPSGLSGGEQQRVAVARALVTKPVAIFADEPTGALDSQAADELLRLLRSVVDEGQTVVMVTHDSTAASFADRVVSMRDGVLVSSDGATAAAASSSGSATDAAAAPASGSATSSVGEDGAEAASDTEARR